MKEGVTNQRTFARQVSQGNEREHMGHRSILLCTYGKREGFKNNGSSSSGQFIDYLDNLKHRLPHGSNSLVQLPQVRKPDLAEELQQR